MKVVNVMKKMKDWGVILVNEKMAILEGIKTNL